MTGHCRFADNEVCCIFNKSQKSFHRKGQGYVDTHFETYDVNLVRTMMLLPGKIELHFSREQKNGPFVKVACVEKGVSGEVLLIAWKINDEEIFMDHQSSQLTPSLATELSTLCQCAGKYLPETADLRTASDQRQLLAIIPQLYLLVY